MPTTITLAPEVLYLDVEMPPTDLPTEDGTPLETNWHRIQINLLIDSLHSHWRDRSDYFAGGNMFIYFSLDQVRNRDYRGPDFFVVKEIDDPSDRGAWYVWEEGGRYPNVIVELSSPTTIDVDLEEKKHLYEKIFRTPEYFCFDPATQTLWGWRLVGGSYVPIPADQEGALWSEQLDLWLGRWQGEYLRIEATWLRLWTPDGDLVLTFAEAEAQRAEAEAQRANAAEAEVARLRARLASLGAANGEE